MYIYSMTLDSDIFTENDNLLLKYVSGQRAAKVLAHRFSKGRRISLYAALLTRFALSDAFGFAPDMLEFDTALNGKPCLKKTVNVFFNLSHSGNTIVCAVSNAGEVGIDTEVLKNAPFKIMKRSFCTSETDYVSDNNIRFFEVWTKKEAYTKFLGTGICSGLQHIDTLSSAYGQYFFSFRLNNNICTVYSETDRTYSHISVSEKDILHFFLLHDNPAPAKYY